MFDSTLRRWIDPPLNRAGRRLASLGATANGMTGLGLALGLLAAALVSFDLTIAALIPLLLSRVADGLDGAVARANATSDFGGYLDITCDFVFYGAIPLAFAIRDQTDALPAAALLFAFYVNGASFLGFAIVAEKRGLETSAQGEKSLYFSAGLLEGGETIAFLVLICLWPAAFAPAALCFAALCLVTAALRVRAASQLFT